MAILRSEFYQLTEVDFEAVGLRLPKVPATFAKKLGVGSIRAAIIAMIGSSRDCDQYHGPRVSRDQVANVP